MTTQYGFFIDSSRCTGCKTCELACKDYKILTRRSASAVFMNMLAATGRKITASGSRTCLPITSPSPVTTAKIRPAPKSAPAARCISAKMALWWSMKMFASAAATATWLVRTARRSTMLKRHMTKCDGCYSRVAEGKQPDMRRVLPAACAWISANCRAAPEARPLAAVALLPRALSRPNIVIKPNANSRPTGDTTGYLANPKECEMGNGWHEWPLVIFTVLGQCVVGALIVSGIGWFAAKNDADRRRLVRHVFPLAVDGHWFIASVMHLGSPLRAFNSLNRIGASV